MQHGGAATAAADSAAANAAFSLVAADGFEGFAPCIAMLHHVKASPKCKVALARDNDDAMEKLGNKKVTPSQKQRRWPAHVVLFFWLCFEGIYVFKAHLISTKKPRAHAY